MKKMIFIIMSVCLFAGLVAQTTPTTSPTFYGKLMMGTWYNTGNSTFSEQMYSNSRLGIRWNNGHSYDFIGEMGMSPNGIVLRKLTCVMNIWNGCDLKIGNDWFSGLDQCTNGATGPTYTSDSPTESGPAVIARTPQITLIHNDLYLSFLPGITVNPTGTETTKSIPRLAVSKKVKILDVNFTPALSYGHYWDKQNSYNAWVVCITAKSKIFDYDITTQGFIANNFGDLGGLSIAQSNATAINQNIQSGGAFAQIRYQNFYVGAGYTKNKTMETDAGTTFFQYNKTMWKNGNITLTLTPEMGLFFGDNVSKNTLYFGSKWTAQF